ncbi:hypothetical protein VA596_49825 [Amycolatopsis sp., V23-08]|uniref:Tape measure protein n=1 Tax=Amycolatopsis heterodermiae TaxID=3110235 RepID=A0ABU5RN14_9PSEU|nr:hypothetical protein [Amycolatopsis sp., V23-08]MEA5367710.1 hypothetical protein [Amycolatopsis sp., V23-08]
MALNVGKLVALFTGDASDYFATSKKVRRDSDELDRKRATTKIDGDSSPLDRAVARARATLATFGEKSTVAQIDADISRAQARIREFESRRGEVGIDVEAEISKAEATIEALTARRRNLTVGVDPDTGSAFRAGAVMGAAVKAGLISAGIGAALTVAMGATAGAGPALLGVATAAGITAGLVASLSKAVKAYSADQKTADSSAAGSAGQSLANSIAIRNAQTAIGDARRRAGEAAVDGARQVEDAERATARAEQDAERATRAVTAARADAARQLDDLADRAGSYKLATEDATLAVEEAKQAQEEANARYGADSLQGRRAALNVVEAEDRLQQTRKDGTEAVNAYADALRKGVEGSDQVVAAKEAEQQAHDRVADSQRAEQTAREQAARSTEDATRQVERAVQALNDTQAQQNASTAAAAGKANTYAAELAKLTPEGRKFVETLIGMRDVADRLGNTTQTATLPGFTRLVEAGRDIEPVLAHGITVTGDAMSDTADKAAALAKSPAFQANLWEAFDNARPVLDAIGDSTVELTDDWVGFMARSAPAGRGLASLIRDIEGGVGDLFDNSVAGMGAYERILTVVGRMGRDTLGELGTLIANVANGSAPEIEHLEQVWRRALGAFGEFGSTYVPGLISGFSSVLGFAVNTLSPIAGLVGSIAGPVTPVVAALKLIDKVTFGGVSGQVDKVKSAMAEADGVRGRFGAGVTAMKDTVFSPWTRALGAAVVALQVWSSMQQQADAAVKQGRDGVASYRDELERTGGVLGENTRALAEKNLASIDAANSDRKLVDVAAELGISLDDLTAAYQGNKSKQDEILASLGGQSTAWYDVVGAVGDAGHQIGYWTGMADDGADMASTLQGQLRILWGDVNKTTDSTKSMTYEQGLAKGAAKDLSADIKTMADSTGDASRRGDALIDFLRKLSGQSPDYEAAVQRINDQMRDLADLFGKNVDKTAGFGRELLNADGSVNTFTANGSRLKTLVDGIASATAGAAQQAYDLAISQGKSVPEAMAAASQVVSDQDGRLRELAGAMGLSAGQMQTLLDKYALTPEDVMSVIGQPGMENAQRQADIYGGKLKAIPNPVNTNFNVNTSPAEEQLRRWYDWYIRNFINNPLPAPVIRGNEGTGLLPGSTVVPGRASGGDVTANSLYKVGEDGEEFFVPKTDGTIIPAGPTAAYQAGMAAAASAPAPQMAAVGGPRSAARGGDGAAMPAASSISDQEFAQRATSLLAEIRSLAASVAERPIQVTANGQVLAAAANRGNVLNKRR